MRCKACNRIQSPEEIKLYDDLCKKCFEIATRPDDDHQDQGLGPVYEDDGWHYE